MAPAEEKPKAAETSVPVKETNEVATPTPEQSTASLSVGKGYNHFFFIPRIYEVEHFTVFLEKQLENYVCKI